MRKYVKVKLVQINFVPTWTNEKDGVVSNERTAVWPSTRTHCPKNSKRY